MLLLFLGQPKTKSHCLLMPIWVSFSHKPQKLSKFSMTLLIIQLISLLVLGYILLSLLLLMILVFPSSRNIVMILVFILGRLVQIRILCMACLLGLPPILALHHGSCMLKLPKWHGQVFTSGFRPRLNGMTEHTHRFLNSALGIYCEHHQEQWEEYLQSAVYTHNVAPISGR